MDTEPTAHASATEAHIGTILENLQVSHQVNTKDGTVKALSSVKGPKFGQCRVYLQKELSTRNIAVTDEC